MNSILIKTNMRKLEIKSKIFFTEPYDYDMVVLVNEDSGINNLENLRGKRLCHPGFFDGDTGNGWSNLISDVRKFITY